MQHIFKSKQGLLKQIIEKVNQLELLNQQIKRHLAPELAPHCKVANFRNGSIIIEVSNAAWATHLRFALSDLLHKLRSEEKLYTASRIDFYVRPPWETQQKTTIERNIKPTEIEKIMQVSEETKDPDLKAAIQSLANSMAV